MSTLQPVTNNRKPSPLIGDMTFTEVLWYE